LKSKERDHDGFEPTWQPLPAKAAPSWFSLSIVGPLLLASIQTFLRRTFLTGGASCAVIFLPTSSIEKKVTELLAADCNL